MEANVHTEFGEFYCKGEGSSCTPVEEDGAIAVENPNLPKEIEYSNIPLDNTVYQDMSKIEVICTILVVLLQSYLEMFCNKTR